jgi:hypothetical protein
MIAALLLRYGIPEWAAKLAALIALAAALIGGAAWYHHHVFEQGVAQESLRRDKIEGENSARADKERDALNVKIATAQKELDAARVTLAALKEDYVNAQAISSDRQRRLRDATDRMSILARPRPSDPNGPPQGGPAGPVDTGASVEVDIDPGVSSWLEGLRAEHNAAVERLQACIVKYDAVKTAADAMP